MEKQLDTRNYIRTQEPKSYLIISIISWIFILFWIFYHPSRSFEDNRDFVQLKGDSIPCFMPIDKGTGIKIYQNDRILSPNAKLKPITESPYDKKRIIVDDEDGNRFAIPISNLQSFPEGLRKLNNSYHYVYNRKDLNGELVTDIINQAGEYSFLDKQKRCIVFPQIVLFNGAERTKGVALFYDNDGRVTKTSVWDTPHSNLYTHIPYYDKIASWNLFVKFQRFTTSSDYESGFFGNAISAIFWFLFDCLATVIMTILILGGTFFAVYPLLYKLCKLPNMPNSLIYVLSYLPVLIMVLLALALLLFFNNIWIWAAICDITYLGMTLVLIYNLSPAYVRCNKCHKMNCIDVTETDFLFRREILSQPGITHIEGKYEPQQQAQEKYWIRTHFFERCTCCGNITEYDRESTKLQEPKNIHEISCPKCGQYSLEAGSLLVKNKVTGASWSSTKHGDIKPTYSLFGPDYKKKDVTTHYFQESGELIYKLTCKCKNCDYEYSETYKRYFDSGRINQGSDTTITTYTKV